MKPAEKHHRFIAMLRISLPLAAVLTILSTSGALVLPAGKCKNVTPMPVDYDNLKNVRQWRMLYYPVGEPFNNVDSDLADVTVGENNEVYTVHRMRMKDNTVSSYTYKNYYGSDNVLYEEITSDNGTKTVFKLIPLDIVPDVLGFLLYRCSETGSLDYDTRYIFILSGNTMSAAGEQELITKDASYNFTGGIQKLDNNLE